MGIGARIAELRTRLGITQQNLALRIGVTPSAVGNYEHDVSFPKEKVLMKLFGALECTPNELLGTDNTDNEIIGHINKYKELDERGRRIVDTCTERQLSRVRREQSKEQYGEQLIEQRKEQIGKENKIYIGEQVKEKYGEESNAKLREEVGEKFGEESKTKLKEEVGEMFGEESKQVFKEESKEEFLEQSGEIFIAARKSRCGNVVRLQKKAGKSLRDYLPDNKNKKKGSE